MSTPTDNTVNIEVNGVPLKARKGQMIIEVTDQVDAYVPRFCYHRKLSIAANCRMCLVDVEKAPKPLPACATPVMEGMKVFTRSKRAIAAQKATMEFLLINHPLDCPICDQGGECELQDLAMGFGRGVSRYTERKRVVRDKNLGPLVSTDMTRCIHCTRCVRFGQEIAGMPELGTVGRGEDMEIGTFIEKSVDHELSGNIIDLCPVGALNNKPYRFSARAWEMIEKPLVSPHDCVGSNLSGHVLRGKLRRIVPRDNDAINESWISDRDRFSCFGLYAEDRLASPMIKRDQQWVDVTWPDGVRHQMWRITDGARIAALTGAIDALPVLYIADGHHRSAAASRVAEARKDKPESVRFFLAVIFPARELTILGYHRVLSDLNGRDAGGLLAALRETFTVEESTMPVEPKSAGEFGLVLGGRWYRLTIRPELIPEVLRLLSEVGPE